MSIETLDDWNERLALCGCCQMPTCPEPQIEAQFIRVSACGTTINSRFSSWLPGGQYYSSEGFDIDECAERYQKFRSLVVTQHTSEEAANGDPLWSNDYSASDIHDYTGEPSARQCTLTQLEEGNPYMFTTGDFAYTPTTVTRIAESTDPWTGRTFRQNNTWAFADPSDYAAVVAELAARDNWQDRFWPIAEHEAHPSCSSALESLAKARFRFRVPEDFVGSYFKITWDEVFFPIGYNPNNAESPQPSVVNQGVTAEWQGPGDPDNADSWLIGDWRELSPPASPGEVRVVNIRYVCHRSKFGSKPQVTGEAYDIPEA